MIASNSPTIIVVALTVLILAVVASYVRAFINPFRTPRMLLIYRRIFPFVAKQSDLFSGAKDSRGKALEELSGRELKDRVASLQYAIIANRCMLYFANRLKEFHKSDFSIASGVISSISILIISFFWFSLAYFGLNKLDAHAFEFSERISYFDYFALSFDNMIFGSSNDIGFRSDVAKAISMLQRFLSALLVIIFITILITVKRKRFELEIDETVDIIEESGREIENHIIGEYKFSNVDEAIESLKNLEASFLNFITRLTNSIK